MSEYPRYQRVIIETEVEVVDPIAANAFTFDVTAEGGMLANDDPEWHIARVVSQLLSDGLTNQSERTGVKLVSASALPRMKTEGGWYESYPLSETPARNDDGSMTMPPSWEGFGQE